VCRAALVLTVVTSCSSIFAADQGDRSLAGPIEHLTSETRALALECGRAGAECAVNRYELCQPLNAQYSVRLITPFSRVAQAAFDAEQGRKPLGRIGPATVNRWGIALSVFPAERSNAAAAIQSVEIHREGQLLRPIRATVGPFTTEGADGSPKQSARGFFSFAANAFEASSDISIVLFGSSGKVSCSINRERLQTLE